MSKLRKLSSPPSTNASPIKSVTTSNGAGVNVRHASGIQQPTLESLEPLTAKEQYWATRALQAEALLKVKDMHHREVKTMSYSQDMKRSREIQQLLKQHEAKHASLEKLVLILMATVIVLVLLIIYLAIHHARHASKVQKSWISGLPSHFTIPILSPFTSVVEKETSVFGTKAIAIIVVVSGAVVFFTFRLWFQSRLQPQPHVKLS
ncbi:hypothetical protein CC1G_02521 [Coprinopsis cinerea okayama7|uniref:Uncharacterized protein n=1 Tax=Coprinopsis cinerea (strain Okayama-7 / 130 / ATCC MYA-4618 / FGSC 9003) TaxID=240176 RepID=A8NBR1_COPC7|nr:hypothetical protein CC1G_02521 [Coprinopsis cinerea okayama7\|eukprot:XP_001832259.1 hypothetical protein CC1G_02521 [Coprinopsis cinerea okayama7\